jgi:hypothetical protein
VSIRISRVSSPFQSLHRSADQRCRQKLHRHGATPPKKLTFGTRTPGINAKIPPRSRKFSPSVRVFSRLGSPMGFSSPKKGQKSGFDTIPKALTSAPTGCPAEFSVLTGDSQRPGPAKSHLSSNPWFSAAPEPAHVLSRTRSPRPPNLITPTSRKTSPPLPQSFTLPGWNAYQVRLCRGVNVFNMGSKVFTFITL